MSRFEFVDNLREWVDSAMGPDATPADIDAAVEWIQTLDHPRWGVDEEWIAFLDRLDLWERTIIKLTVWAPATPGAEPSLVGQCDTIADAREIAERFEHRRDLRMQDVVIRAGRDGKIVELCGPCR
jgi:hypothetical protein